MAIQVIQKLVKGTGLSLGRDGVRVTWKYQVNGLDPTKSCESQAWHAAGIPFYGQAHPDIPGLFVSGVDVEPFGNSRTQAWVTVTFNDPNTGGLGSGTPLGWKISITGSTQTIQRQFDKDGKLCNVFYWDKNLYPNAGDSQKFKNVAQFQFLEPHMIITAERDEFTNRLGDIVNFLGRVNSVQYQGFPPRALLCREFDVALSLAFADQASFATQKTKFRTRISFEARPYDSSRLLLGWDHLAYFIFPETGHTPNDIDAAGDVGNGIDPYTGGRGWRGFKVQGEADFNALGLPIISTV